MSIKHRLLLVEDEQDHADLLSRRLARLPISRFDICHVKTVSEAADLLGIQPMDVIILDLNLPDSGGIATVKRIKAAAGDAPIIVVSDAVNDQVRSEALIVGAADAVTKEEADSSLFWRAVLHIIERDRAVSLHRAFERFLTSIPDAIVVLNRDAVVRYANQAALTLFGREAADFVGKPAGFTVREGEPLDVTVVRADGVRLCEVRAVEFQWDDERVLLAAIRDLTDLRTAQRIAIEKAEIEERGRNLNESSGLKSEFLANVSHELRTPLNAIIGFSKLLYAGKVGPLSETQTEYIGDVLKSADHLLQIINDILDLAKVEAGKIDVRVETVDLRATVREVRDILRGGAAEKRIRLEMEVDRRLKTVDTDPRLFKQVLYNYLSNAIKFTPEDGRVDMRVVLEPSETFRVEVVDSGPGIRPDDMGRLFVEFQQLASGKIRSGTGLGLALSKRIVEALGGKVGVRSVLGQGSVFSATFPCVVTRSASLILPVRDAALAPATTTALAPGASEPAAGSRPPRSK